MSGSYAKIFQSLFDGSLRGKGDAILVFVNLLTHAGSKGIADVHFKKVADETGLSEKRVRAACSYLESPDPDSRSPDEEGRRIVRLDTHRNWGWRVVNHRTYREALPDDFYRQNAAARMRKMRERQAMLRNVTQQDQNVTQPSVHASVHDTVQQEEGVLGGETINGWVSRSNTHTANAPCEIPSLEQAIAMTMTCAIPEDFIRLVYSKWAERGGCDGAAVPVDWLRHVKGRWEREGQQWIKGFHPGQRGQNGSKPNDQAPLWSQIKALEDAIENHRGNTAKGWSPPPTELEISACRQLKSKLKQLKEKQVAEITST